MISEVLFTLALLLLICYFFILPKGQNLSSIAKGPVLVLSSSQTGTAASLASSLNLLLPSNVAVASVSLSGVTQDLLDSSPFIVFIVATHYDGDPPDDGVTFFSKLKKGELVVKSKKVWLFGLGDSSYVKFNAFGKNLAVTLKENDVKVIEGFGDARKGEQGPQFRDWFIPLLSELTQELPDVQRKNLHSAFKPPKPFAISFNAQLGEYQPNARLKRFMAARPLEIKDVKVLYQGGQAQEEAMALTLTAESSDFGLADNLALFPQNTQSDITRAINFFGLSGDEKVSALSDEVPFPHNSTIEALFTSYYDLRGPPLFSNQRKFLPYSHIPLSKS